MSGVAQPAGAGRLASLDAFRGFDMCFIMAFDGLVASLAWLFSGIADWNAFLDASWIARQMRHVPWNGLHWIDCVFPTFLFIAGVSFPYSYAKQVARGDSPRAIHLRLLRRALVLIALGVAYNGFFGLEFPMRYGSVLGKIGFAWGFAALLYVHFRAKARVGIAFGILLAYWLVTRFVPAPDAPPGTDVFTAAGCFAGWVDRMIMPGVFYCKDPATGRSLLEPNGLVVCVAAIPTAMFGMLAGDFVRSALSGAKKAAFMLLASAALVALGLLVSLSFPINKIMWSPSFTLVAGGGSLAFFAAFYWLMDVKGWRRWAFFFRVIGMNSIFIYLFQRVVPVRTVSLFFVGGLARLVDPGEGAAWSCVVYAGQIAVCWLVLYFLYRKQTFLRT
ncbi:MAG: DUF5009 domain-containing protein [Kiritimatiellae bacterium]|nr:DUF5009 domain-containing protein [Kiritimatiellia bacterium]